MDSADSTQQRVIHELAEPSRLPPSRRDAPLSLMLGILQEQDNERQRSAGPLAASLLRACASLSGRARERAQVTAHEVLRYAKAGNAQRASAPASTGEELLLPTRIRAVNSSKDGRGSTGNIFTQQDVNLHSNGQGIDSTNINGVNGDGYMNTRLRSKADRCREDLLRSAFQATK